MLENAEERILISLPYLVYNLSEKWVTHMKPKKFLKIHHVSRQGRSFHATPVSSSKDNSTIICINRHPSTSFSSIYLSQFFYYHVLICSIIADAIEDSVMIMIKIKRKKRTCA